MKENKNPKIRIRFPVLQKYNKKFIEEKRKLIYDNTIKTCKITGDANGLTEKNLEFIAMLYDKIFFHDQIQLWDKNARNTIEFRFGRGTKTAGLCEYTTYSKGRATFNECTIKISRPLFRKAYAKGGSHIANGIRCNDKLTAIMVTLEHELMHFLIYANPKINDNKRGKVYGSHGILFQDLTRSYFGHTKTYHELLVN